MSNLERIIIGALGGLSAVLVKFLGQDYANVVANAANLTADQIFCYKIGYGLLTPILMFLGSFVAWTSDETKRLKLVALAVAAPALITTWAGGSKPGIQEASIDLFTTSAYAQHGEVKPILETQTEPSKTSQRSALEVIRGGIGSFFGYGNEPKKYWVIVGSYKDRDAAKQFANKINDENKELNAWIGMKVPPNEYYPVIIGGYNYLNEAKILKEKALQSDTINEAYLSSGAQR